MKISLKNIMNYLTTKKYEIKDESGNIDEEKSIRIAKYAIISSQEL